MKTKKHPKKDLRKWTLAFFQIGLILALLISWLILEGKTYEKEETAQPFVITDQFSEFTEEIDFVQKAKPQPKPQPIPQQKLTDHIKIGDDKTEDHPDTVKLDDLLGQINGDDSEPIDIDHIPSLDTGKTKVQDIDPVPIMAVQEVPIFPGCERYKDNRRKIECLNQQVQKFITRRFDTDLAAQQGILGLNRISVQFTVNETGNVTQILTRAKEPVLEREAQRVIDLLPVFQPGKQNNKPVKVIYQLSIVLDIQ